MTAHGETSTPLAVTPQGAGVAVEDDAGSGRWTRSGVVLVVAYVALLALAIVAPAVMAPHDPLQLDASDRLAAPSLAHPFGTDEAGRDVLSRIVYGARVTVLPALLIVGLAATFGTLVGSVAAFVGGAVDFAVMRIVDTFMSFPYVILALTLAGMYGRGMTTAVIALAVIWWPSYARLSRGLVLSIRERLFIDAAIAAGTGRARLIVRHVIPHMRRELAVRLSIDCGSSLIALAGLSFLGLGPSPPDPNWGLMVTSSRLHLTEAWWYAVFPGLAIFSAAFFYALAGDMLQSRDDGGRRRGALRRLADRRGAKA
jgi:peptide/nickel transport system permease protein